MFGRLSGLDERPVAAMNSRHYPSSVPARRAVLTVNGTSRLTYVTRHTPARQEVFTLLPKRFMTSSKRQVVRMSLSVIAGFVACWLPYFVVSLIRIFTDYRVRLPGLLSAAELLALAHSALNPLIYGLFSARTLRQSCGQRCQRRRLSVVLEGRSLMPSWCCCCCYCCRQVVADVSPDALPPPLITSPQRQPPIELRDMARVGSEFRRRGGRSADGRPTPPPTHTSTTDTTHTSTTDTVSAEEVYRCHKSASVDQFQRGSGSAATRLRRVNVQLTDHGAVSRVITNHQRVSMSDRCLGAVTGPSSTSINKR